MELLGPSLTCGHDQKLAGCDSKEGFCQNLTYIGTLTLDVRPPEL